MDVVAPDDVRCVCRTKEYKTSEDTVTEEVVATFHGKGAENTIRAHKCASVSNLSAVGSLLLRSNQMKILISTGILKFHKSRLVGLVCPASVTNLYRKLTVNFCLGVHCHLSRSGLVEGL